MWVVGTEPRHSEEQSVFLTTEQFLQHYHLAFLTGNQDFCKDAYVNIIAFQLNHIHGWNYHNDMDHFV